MKDLQTYERKILIVSKLLLIIFKYVIEMSQNKSKDLISRQHSMYGDKIVIQLSSMKANSKPLFLTNCLPKYQENFRSLGEKK